MGGSRAAGAPVDPYNTNLKVYTVGARVSETLKPVVGDVKYHPVQRPRKRVYRRLPVGAVPGYCPIVVDSNDPQTVASAFNQRLLRQLPTANPILLTRLKAFVQEYCRTHVRKVGIPDFEEWLAHTNYNENRKAQLRLARESLRGGPPTLRQRRRVDSFVKTESYPSIKYGRMINSRSDAFKAYSGPWFAAIEREVYQMPEFVKHLNNEQRKVAVQNLIARGRRYVATDFTAFESHFTPEVMDALELVLYRHCLQDYPELCNVICSTISGSNNMRTRTGVRATCQARRMSGDMCTSLGNGWSNLMLFKFLLSLKDGRGGGLVEGDDGLFWSDVPITKEDYQALGFTIKIENVPDPMKASFCGIMYGDNPLKDPRRVFQTFGWTHHDLHAGDKIMRELSLAKAISLRAEVPNCPIVGQLSLCAYWKTNRRFFRPVKPRFVYDGYHQIPRSYSLEFNPTSKDRSTFAELFGISPEVQELAEQAIRDSDYLTLSRLIPPSHQQAWFAERYVEVT